MFIILNQSRQNFAHIAMVSLSQEQQLHCMYYILNKQGKFSLKRKKFSDENHDMISDTSPGHTNHIVWC